MEFQEDNAPFHRSRATALFFRDNFGALARLPWPSNSPDMNVMDFCVWGAAKAKMPAACTSRHEMLGHIQRVSNELRDTLSPEKVMAAFEARLSALIAAEGGYWCGLAHDLLKTNVQNAMF